MNSEQTNALDKMIEWRNALHEKVQDRDGDLWDNPNLALVLIAMRNVMNDVAVAFGRESFVQDSSLATSAH